MLELFTRPETWISLITLTVMEIVLGIDNVIFISLVTGKLPRKDQNKARQMGLFLALFIRIILLACISYIVHEMTAPVFHLIDHPISWHDVILLSGGLFLIYKSTLEIYEVLEAEGEHKTKEAAAQFWNIVFQVILIDIVFSFDSIITAVGLARDLPVMILAVVISMFIMLFFSSIISDFINKHPSIKLLALAFLVVIGVLLIIAGWDAELAEHTNLKSYLYFAMAFSVGIELLNMRMRKGKKEKPVKLKDIYK